MTMLRPLSVMIADDHFALRRGIITVLQFQELIERIDEASNGEEVLLLLSKQYYDVILMDIRMPPTNGIEITKIVKQRYPNVKVIGLSSFDEDLFVTRMIEAGASGYLLKNTETKELLHALRVVADHGTYFSKEVSPIATKMRNQGVEKRSEYHEQVLEEIAFLISYGKSSEEISEILSFKKRTIDTYRLELNDQAGTKNMAGIIRYTVRSGIADDEHLKKKFEKYIQSKKSA